MEFNEEFDNHIEQNDDVILPDDFGAEEPTEPVEPEAQPQAEETPTEEPTQEETPEETIQKIKVKYNHEEKELPLDEAVPLIQKGMNYDKALERAKQEARDQWVAEQGYQWQGKPITTEAEYKQALMEQELINKYKDKDLPDEVIQELIENRKFREQYKTSQKEKESQEKSNQEYVEFFDYFRSANGRDFDTQKDTIPQEVWDKVNQGVPLRFAYIEHQNNELQSQLKVLKQNEENKQKAPVKSVTNHGAEETASEDPFLRGFNN